MAKFKKIIPALCMLLVSAIMLGGTTFAWFSMNDNVTANGMNVTAKSDTTYLMISKEKTTESAYGTSVSFASDAVSLKPCAFNKSETNIGGTTIQANKFYTASSKKYDSANYEITNVSQVADGSMNTYVLTSTVYIRLSNDSAKVNDGTLRLEYQKEENTHEAVKAVVLINGNYYELPASGSTTYVDVTGVNLSNVAAEAIEVKIYVYIDGNNEDVNSNYFNTATTEAQKLSGNVGVKFTLNPTV